jgi:hypothetical protein
VYTYFSPIFYEDNAVCRVIGNVLAFMENRYLMVRRGTSTVKRNVKNVPTFFPVDSVLE